ncbi:MAG: hypothetical protein ACKO3T_12360 [Planctomycetaceae bacterium]
MRVSSAVAGQLSIGDVCLFIGQSDTGVVAVPGISVSGAGGSALSAAGSLNLFSLDALTDIGEF